MTKKISPEAIKEIAQNLDCGMQCYYHKETGEVESFPDENCMPGFERDDWKAIIKKVKKHKASYISLVPPDSFESFRLRQDFIEQITDAAVRNEGLEYIARRKPFQQFNIFLSEYPGYREKWFAYKQEWLETYVAQQLQFQLYE